MSNRSKDRSHSDPKEQPSESPNSEPQDSFYSLPNEILASYIFPFLDGITFIKCRQVCQRWKEVVDQINSETLWYEFCKREYGDFMDSTLRNGTDQTSRFEIYKNLYRWYHLTTAQRKEYHLDAGPIGGDIMQVTTDSTLVSVQENGIQFFDLNTFKLHQDRTEIGGKYLDFQENETVKVILCHNHDLFITWKVKFAPDAPFNAFYTSVHGFYLDTRYVYFHDGVGVSRCKLGCTTISPQFLGSLTGGIDQLAVYQSKLYIRTLSGRYWLLKDIDIFELIPPNSCDKLVGMLRTHNNDEKSVPDCLKLVSSMLAPEDLQTITCTFTYNSLLIMGSLSGELLIYCLRLRQLLLRFDQCSVTACDNNMSRQKIRKDARPTRAIKHIQVYESSGGISFITATAAGNGVTKFYRGEVS